MNIGLLVLRIVVGGLFIGHGSQKLFGWFGGGGLEGTGQMYDKIGFRPGRRMAMLAGASEFGGGALLVLGFLSPLGSAAIIGMMTAATLSVHLPNGMWNSNGGMEFPLTLATVAGVVAFTGPGTISVDKALGTGVWGSAPAIAATVLGVGLAVFLDQVRKTNLRDNAAETGEGEEQRRAA